MCTVWAALFLFLSPFPFRYRFAALLRTPSPLAPSLSFIHLSLSSSLNHVPFFFFPAPPSPPLPLPLPCPPSAPLRSSFPTLRLRPSFSRPARPLSLVISSSFARSRFFSRFFHRPLRFFLSLMPTVLVPFAYHHRLLSLSFLTPSSLRAVPSSSLPSLSTYPAASVETARFFPPVSSAPIFFTPFSPPSHPFDGYPCAALPRHRNIASSIRFVSLSVVSHIRTWSLSLSSRLSSALFLLSFVHLSLPSHLSFIFPCLSPPPLSLSLSLLPPPSSPAFHPCGSYLFDFFFTATRPPTDAARRRSFSIGTLFSTIGSTTYSRTHVRTLVACARGRDGEIKKGVKRELVDVGGKGGPGDVREERG